jgi:bifunctional NMN adenylyltransferase/nudix hydrolase
MEGEAMRKNKVVGVIVARFQVATLHVGHRYLIESVIARHDKVLVVLGSGKGLASNVNPLDFETRRLMVLAEYPNVEVRELVDHRQDVVWSRNLDSLIEETFPGCRAKIYGSRGSCLPQYGGRFPRVALEPVPSCSGTEVRNGDGKKILASCEFRAGVIYREMTRRPVAYSVIDVAIIKPEEQLVLLGQRTADGGKLRFIGGFVDVLDESLERTVKREVREEAGDIEIDDLRYIGSAKIDDWRYMRTSDGIMSTFFVATYIFGHAKGGDDIQDVSWVPWQDVDALLVDEHKQFGRMLDAYLTKNYGKE